MKMKLLTFIICIGVASTTLAQNMSINETGAEPNNSAMLDVQSTSKGLLIPRMTEAQRSAVATPANGLMVYQTDGATGLYIYDGVASNWEHSLDSSDVFNLTQQERSLNDTAGVHLMTKELVTDGNFISGDGDLEGISVDFNGRVNVTGGTAGNTNLTVNGMVRTTGQGDGYEFSNNQIQITGNNGNTGDLRLRTSSADRVRITAGGSVGIGTNAPSELLDVNGSVMANGEFRYAIPDTNVTSIPPSAFVSARPESYELNALGVILYISIGGSGGIPGWAVAPLEVPNGATVIEITYVYYDNDGTNNFNAGVTRYGNLVTSGTSLFSFTSAGSSASYQSSTVTGSFAVDYENFAYHLQFQGVRGNTNIRLKNVIVKYVVDQAD